MIDFLGYGCAIVIGVILGLMGGGGSILTVPVLVYILGLNPVTATAYSLFIVGTTSAFGTIQNLKRHLVDVKTGLLFAVPSLIGVYLSRKFLVPAIPEKVFRIGDFVITKSILLMVLFAIVIFIAALSMLRKSQPETGSLEKNKTLIVIQTFFAGILVGMVGAGGGFLFIPILIYVAKLPVKKAIATSLMIISVNSVVGFTGDLENIFIDWPFLLTFTGFSILGIFTGIYFNKLVNENQLKNAFGWFVLAMALVILTKEFLF